MNSLSDRPSVSHSSLRRLTWDAFSLFSMLEDRLFILRSEFLDMMTWNVHVLRVISLTNGTPWLQIILSTSSKCHFSSSVDFWHISLYQPLKWKFHHSFMLFEFFLVFVCNRFYGWLVVRIVKFFLRTEDFLNFCILHLSFLIYLLTCVSWILLCSSAIKRLLNTIPSAICNLCNIYIHLIWSTITDAKEIIIKLK